MKRKLRDSKVAPRKKKRKALPYSTQSIFQQRTPLRVSDDRFHPYLYCCLEGIKLDYKTLTFIDLGKRAQTYLKEIRIEAERRSRLPNTNDFPYVVVEFEKPHPYSQKILLAAIDRLPFKYNFEIKGTLFYSDRDFMKEFPGSLVISLKEEVVDIGKLATNLYQLGNIPNVSVKRILMVKIYPCSRSWKVLAKEKDPKPRPGKISLWYSLVC